MNIYDKKTMGETIKGNEYVGRGIVIGMTEDAKKAAIAYFIMGRSENSRNRVFREEADSEVVIYPFDESKVEDPSLIIYSPIKKFENKTIVTNGDQTQTIYEFLQEGKCFHRALNTRCFEPDGPNWTPRISGLVRADGSFLLSILKSDNGDDRCCIRSFFDYDAPIPGTGRFISTYCDNANPLPSFAGEPIAVTIPDEFGSFVDAVWASLNEENRVSIYACEIALDDWTVSERIINKHTGG